MIVVSFQIGCGIVSRVPNFFLCTQNNAGQVFSFRFVYKRLFVNIFKLFFKLKPIQYLNNVSKFVTFQQISCVNLFQAILNKKAHTKCFLIANEKLVIQNARIVLTVGTIDSLMFVQK